MSPAEIIMAALLDESLVVLGLPFSAGVGTQGAASGDWRVGVGVLLDAPDEQVICVDGPGQPPDPKWLLEYPFVQVLVRGMKDGYQAAYQKARDVYDMLLGIPTLSGSWGRIDGITAPGTPSFIGLDQLNRPIFSANYKLFFEPATSALTNREPL